MYRNSELYCASLEPKLLDWILQYTYPHELIDALPQMFANLDKSSISGTVEGGVTINGPVHIGAGSVVHSGAVIDGPVIIGENVSIRSHAQIRNMTYIGSNCVVGHSADIKRSLILNEAKVQDGTFVGESVLGFGARVGSGAILANRKFNQSKIRIQRRNGELVDSERDFLGSAVGDYARIGANCSLSPGTVVGQHTWIASGVVLLGSYASDLFISVKQEHEVKAKDRFVLSSGHGEYEKV